MKYWNVSSRLLLTSLLLVVRGGVGEEEGGNDTRWEICSDVKRILFVCWYLLLPPPEKWWLSSIMIWNVLYLQLYLLLQVLCDKDSCPHVSDSEPTGKITTEAKLGSRLGFQFGKLERKAPKYPNPKAVWLPDVWSSTFLYRCFCQRFVLSL